MISTASCTGTRKTRGSTFQSREKEKEKRRDETRVFLSLPRTLLFFTRTYNSYARYIVCCVYYNTEYKCCCIFYPIYIYIYIYIYIRLYVFNTRVRTLVSSLVFGARRQSVGGERRKSE